MARSSSVTEAEVGITCFTSSSLPGFRGVLKHRYSDFIVHEVARDGSVVRLTSLDLPDECVEPKEEEKAAPSADADHSQALDKFSGLCGEADCSAVRGLIEKAAAGGGEGDFPPVILSPDADKAHRSEVHGFFKNNFKFLVTDTVEHSDGVQKCIRVRVGSEAGGGRGRGGGGGGRGRGGRGGGGRGRKRKDMNGSDWGPYDSRGSSNWPAHIGKFMRFNLCKENKDTQDALGVIGKMLGLQSRAFGFSGTKDKRAVTTQQVTVFKVPANKLAALNKRLYGIKVGNFCYVKEGLGLGQLMGNRFTITLRGVVAESEDVIKAAVDGLGKNGFINYYGLQRFGSGSVPTHLIGAALLRGEWKTAVNLVLDPREGERDDIKEVREHYKQHGDIDMALRNFPRHLVAERSILLCLRKSPDNYLQALKGIPRTLRMMYVHSYQSYLWNHAASMRVEKYGISQVIEGDLIYSKESRPEEATSVGTSEADDGHTNSSDLDISSEILPEENIQSVKIVDSEDLLKGIYSFEDVVLPLPGSQALFPGNEVAEIYHEIAKKDGISLTESAHGVKEFSITSMKGGYRRVFQKPIDFEWELMTYTDDSASLAETDLDLLSKDKLTDAKVANEPTSTGNSVSKTADCKLEGPLQTSMPTSETSVVENKSIGSSDTLPSKLAVKLTFTLPASTYATMAIRELLKNSTSVSYQKTLDC